MEVVVHNEVREHNNTIFPYFVCKDTRLLKQAAAVAACAEVSGSWGGSFMSSGVEEQEWQPWAALWPLQLHPSHPRV